MPRAFGVAIAAALIPLTAAAADVGYITQCFTSVLPGQTAILSNDLSCPSYPVGEVDVPPIIGLQQGSRLMLNGHMISGGNYGIRNSGKAWVTGPGRITGMTVAGILMESQMTISDVTIDGNEYGVFDRYRDRVKLRNVTLSSNAMYGLITGPSGLRPGRVRGRNVTADGNGRAGIEGSRVAIRGIHATDNAYSGVIGGCVKLADGTVTGNGASGFAGYEQVDIASFVCRPALPGVTCDHSSDDVGVAWGVCALDP
jgi:hypothetical protein